MGEICIGDVRSLFKSNYVSRLTSSQVVAFEIGDGGRRGSSTRETSWESDAFAYGIELFHSKRFVDPPRPASNQI